MGGRSTLSNGQALCIKCNLDKGDKMITLQPWQQQVVKDFEAKYDQDIYVTVAGTGCGKTFAGAAMAAKAFMVESDKNPLIVICCPYRSIKKGWQKALKSYGIRATTNNNHSSDPSLDAIICTYASAKNILGVAYSFDRPIILILDEFHHVEENGEWAKPYADMEIGSGQTVIKALLFSGTPWHESGALPSHLVTYDDNGYVKADMVYSYGQAVNEEDADRNVVPVEFDLIDGIAYQDIIDNDTNEKVDERAYDTENMRKSDTISPFVNFTASNITEYDAVVEMISRGVGRLNQVRNNKDTSTCGGLIIVMGIEQAKAVKRYIHDAHGKTAILVTSDDPKAGTAIETFRENRSQEWLIAVDMVSEGVDVPRLKVLVDLTNKLTLLHIIQRWGRVLRRVRNNAGDFIPNPAATVYAIKHPKLAEVAAMIEAEIKKEKAIKKGDGEAPECTTSSVTTGQDYNGTTIIAHGQEIEHKVHALAMWLWENNYRRIRDGRRAHPDCVWIARNMILDGNIPANFEEPEKEVASGRTYDDEKAAAVEELCRAVGRLSHANDNGGNYSAANKQLNKYYGISEFKSAKESIEVIEKRTAKANQFSGWTG